MIANKNTRRNPIIDNLVPCVKDNINTGSVTDGWQGYTPLRNNGYSHKVRNIAQSGKEASELLPHVHLVVSLNERPRRKRTGYLMPLRHPVIY